MGNNTWMRTKGFSTFTWPVKSTDNSIVEHVWSVMARCVYRGHSVYSILYELKVEIKNIWEHLTINYLERQQCSIPRRFLAIIESKRGDTDFKILTATAA